MVGRLQGEELNGETKGQKEERQRSCARCELWPICVLFFAVSSRPSLRPGRATRARCRPLPRRGPNRFAVRRKDNSHPALPISGPALQFRVLLALCAAEASVGWCVGCSGAAVASDSRRNEAAKNVEHRAQQQPPHLRHTNTQPSKAPSPHMHLRRGLLVSACQSLSFPKNTAAVSSSPHNNTHIQTGRSHRQVSTSQARAASLPASTARQAVSAR